MTDQALIERRINLHPFFNQFDSVGREDGLIRINISTISHPDHGSDVVFIVEARDSGERFTIVHDRFLSLFETQL